MHDGAARNLERAGPQVHGAALGGRGVAVEDDVGERGGLALVVHIHAAAVLAGIGRDGAVGKGRGAVGANAAAVSAARVLGNAAVGHLQCGAAGHHNAAGVARGLVAGDGTTLHVERTREIDAAAVSAHVAARDSPASARVANGEGGTALHPDDVARAALRALVGKAAVERVAR